jgi:hypothetical protein
MRTDFTPMNEALNALADAINATHSALTAKANAERVELMVLYANMRDTHADMKLFGEIMTNTAQTLGYAGASANEYAKLIDSVIDGGEDAIPECDYEEFVDFCDGCGKTVTIHDQGYILDGDECLCPECAADEEDEAEDEPVDGEQLTIDETVAVEG